MNKWTYLSLVLIHCFCHHIIVKTLQSMCQLWQSTNLFIISASLRKSIFSSTLLPSFNVFTATATLMKHWFEDQLREIQFNRFISFNSKLHLFISTSPSTDDITYLLELVCKVCAKFSPCPEKTNTRAFSLSKAPFSTFFKIKKPIVNLNFMFHVYVCHVCLKICLT